MGCRCSGVSSPGGWWDVVTLVSHHLEGGGMSLHDEVEVKKSKHAIRQTKGFELVS